MRSFGLIWFYGKFISSFLVKASSFDQTPKRHFCAITNLLCIGYLLPPVYVVLRKGNVLVMSVCLFTGGSPFDHYSWYHWSVTAPLHHHMDTCQPTSIWGPFSSSLTLWTLGTPYYMEIPRHTSIGKRSVGLQLKGFLFSVFESNSWIIGVVLCSITLCTFRS